LGQAPTSQSFGAPAQFLTRRHEEDSKITKENRNVIPAQWYEHGWGGAQTSLMLLFFVSCFFLRAFVLKTAQERRYYNELRASHPTC
jgi:ABC-type uncharacterized transport system fused permease/ATPase subunit